MSIPINSFLDLLSGVKKTANGHDAKCPAHDDQHASMSVSEADNGGIVVYCHAGCEPTVIMSSVGLTMRDLAPNGAANAHRKQNRRIVATYPYLDKLGTLVYEIVRYEPKDFRARRPDGQGGWIHNLEGVERVLYRLPALLDAIAREEDIYIVEGEKDADRLAALGIAATCNPGGAGKWRDSYSKSLEGATRVFVVSDNDSAGRKHAVEVARSIGQDCCAILELPGLPPKGDASDWIAAGGTREQLESLANDAWERRSAIIGELRECIQDESETTPAKSEKRIGKAADAKESGESDPLTGLASAKRFAKRYGANVRHVEGIGWLTWTGKR